MNTISIVISQIKLTEKQQEKLKLKNVFNIAYKIAKHGKPFTDFILDCKIISFVLIEREIMFLVC